jgi:hypothetical protein
MIHHYIKEDASGDHYAVSHSSTGSVLIQLQENGEQVRLAISPEQAIHLYEEIKKHAILALNSRQRFLQAQSIIAAQQS